MNMPHHVILTCCSNDPIYLDERLDELMKKIDFKESKGPRLDNRHIPLIMKSLERGYDEFVREL